MYPDPHPGPATIPASPQHFSLGGFSSDEDSNLRDLLGTLAFEVAVFN